MPEQKIESFSIHFDITVPTDGKGSGEIREEISEAAFNHPAIDRARTSVVKDGPFEHKLGD